MESRARTPRERLLTALLHVTVVEIFVMFLGIVTFTLFGLLARAVLSATFDSVNRTSLEAIHSYQAPWLDTAALAVTSLGSVPAVVLIGAVVAWLLVRAGRRIDAWTLTVVLIGAGIMSVTLKIFFGVARPVVFEPLYHAAGMSFPSGHSLISFTLCGFVAAALVRRRAHSVRAWTGAIAAIVLAALVALSRLYIGVHWPTDVVAGMLLATAWLSFAFWGRRFVRSHYARLARSR